MLSLEDGNGDRGRIPLAGRAAQTLMETMA